jgi:hypothetical protein
VQESFALRSMISLAEFYVMLVPLSNGYGRSQLEICAGLSIVEKQEDRDSNFRLS